MSDVRQFLAETGDYGEDLPARGTASKGHPINEYERLLEDFPGLPEINLAAKGAAVSRPGQDPLTDVSTDVDLQEEEERDSWQDSGSGQEEEEDSSMEDLEGNELKVKIVEEVQRSFVSFDRAWWRANDLSEKNQKEIERVFNNVSRKMVALSRKDRHQWIPELIELEDTRGMRLNFLSGIIQKIKDTEGQQEEEEERSIPASGKGIDFYDDESYRIPFQRDFFVS